MIYSAIGTLKHPSLEGRTNFFLKNCEKLKIFFFESSPQNSEKFPGMVGSTARMTRMAGHDALRSYLGIWRWTKISVVYVALSLDDIVWETTVVDVACAVPQQFWSGRQTRIDMINNRTLL